MENCFQNINCFSWIIPVLLCLNYWYNNSQYLELPCFSHHVCQILYEPTETYLQHNPHHVFHRFPYFVLPHSIMRHHKCWIYKTIYQAKAIKFITKLYTDHSQQQLCLQYKLCWILYKMVGTPSFSQPYLCIKPPLESLSNIRSTISVNFHLPIPPSLVHKDILTISSNTPFFYTSANFFLPISTYNHPNNLHQKYFPHLSHLSNSGCVKGLGS